MINIKSKYLGWFNERCGHTKVKKQAAEEMTMLHNRCINADKENREIKEYINRILYLSNRLNSEEFESCAWFNDFDELMNFIKFQLPRSIAGENTDKKSSIEMESHYADK